VHDVTLNGVSDVLHCHVGKFLVIQVVGQQVQRLELLFAGWTPQLPC
jgi:hypothetical protein